VLQLLNNFNANIPKQIGMFFLIGLGCMPVRAQLPPTACILAKQIYTADTSNWTAEALIIQDGQIAYVGSRDSALIKFPKASITDYGNAIVYPGFIDAHCHFLGYAQGLNEAQLYACESIQDVLKVVKKQAKKQKKLDQPLRSDDWIIGRGWDQNLWGGGFPSRRDLDAEFPQTPVCLSRVDGHAVWLNSAAERLLNIDTSMSLSGGEQFSGIYVDAWADWIKDRIPPMNEQALAQSVQQAEQLALASGLTSLHEAGLSVDQAQWLQSLQAQQKLHLRFNVMLSASESTFGYLAQYGQWQSNRMQVHAVKFYMDGALGSRGALLKEDYCDRLHHRGLQLMSLQELGGYAYFLRDKGIQVCVHAIGDSANATVLKLFNQVLEPGHDARWRVEHAQIVTPNDWHYFAQRSIIPSVQPTHATSDAPWAENRLCSDRMPGAYAYQSLLDTAGLLALGTDFPVESIDPINTFYSAVFRSDRAGNLAQPFGQSQALSRRDAFLGMTHWAAYAGFEDRELGQLAEGFQADYVVLNCDLMNDEAKRIRKAKVKATVIAGEALYGR
jgi:predicted amidohydrolase YtcJ